MIYDPDEFLESDKPIPHNKRQTSKDAAEFLSKSGRGTLNKVVVYKYLDRHGILTCEHLEDALGMSHQSCSSAITQLSDAGWLEDSGEKGVNKSGREAIKWRTVNPTQKAVRDAAESGGQKEMF